MITVDNLVKQFGTIRAVGGISFEVQQGEVLGFLGPNGAGKSTTMKMLTCFLRPDSGTATLGGCNISEDPVGVRQRIGYVPENAPLYDEMTVESFLRFMCDMRGLKGAAGTGAIGRVVDMCSIGNVYHQVVGTLFTAFNCLDCHLQHIVRNRLAQFGLLHALLRCFTCNIGVFYDFSFFDDIWIVICCRLQENQVCPIANDSKYNQPDN
jgi:ABC-2 type transport system ATP-binding protein